jgi:SAM-dependent methyltransferase
MGEAQSSHSAFAKRLMVSFVSIGERLQLWLLRQSWFENRLLPMMPRTVRWALRRLYAAPIDLAERLSGRDATKPPRSVTFTGTSHDFTASGQELISALQQVAGLTPSSRILDIGCGVGRLGVAALQYLDSSGHYEGIDIVPAGIDWCTQNITSPHNNVHFTLADIYNGEYNPRGTVRANEYRFPFEDNSIDVAVLLSVFTHMLPADVENYISEIARMLRPGGHIYGTWYVLNPESLQLMKTTNASHQFKENRGSYWVRGGRVDELAIAYDETVIRGMHESHGLGDQLMIHYGGWCGRTLEQTDSTFAPLRRVAELAADGGQDTVIAAKGASR